MSDTGDLIRTDLPNGAAVFYRDSDHSYWRDVKFAKGKWSGTGRLTGVSTVVSPLDFRPDNLMRYAARRNGDGISALAAEGLSLEDPDDIRAALGWLQTGDSIWAALADARLLYSDHTDDRAREGTNVHELALHALAQGQAVPQLRALTEEEKGFARGVMGFWHEQEPDVLQAEQVVFSETHGVAGRFDLRAKLHGEACVWTGERYEWTRLAGAVCLVDAKTSAFIPNKHPAQLAGYNLLAEESGFGASERQFVLQLVPDGGYRLVETRATARHFVNALTVYRDAAEIARTLNHVRKAATEPRAVAA